MGWPYGETFDGPEIGLFQQIDSGKLWGFLKEKFRCDFQKRVKEDVTSEKFNDLLEQYFYEEGIESLPQIGITNQKGLDDFLTDVFEVEQFLKLKAEHLIERKQYTRQDGKNYLTPFIKDQLSTKLDKLFDSVEKMELPMSDKSTPPHSLEQTHYIDGFNRGTLLIVDGKTVSERMMENYIIRYEPYERQKALMNNVQFRMWYHNNLNQLSAEFVSDALLAGKPVVAYLPEAAGGMPKQFVQLKIGQNLEKFMGISEQADTKTQATMKEAGIRLRANCRRIEAQHLHPNSTFVRNLFRMKETKDAMAVPICIGLMSISNGRSIQDIVDSPELQQEREHILREAFKNKLLAEPLATYKVDQKQVDQKQLGELFFTSHVLLHHQMNLMMNGKDLSNPEVRDEVFPYLYLTSQVMSKMSEYMNENKAAQKAYKDLLKQARKDVENMPQQIDNVSALCELMHEADSFRAMMGRPLSFHHDKATMSRGLAAQITEYGILRNWDSTKPFIEQCPSRKKIDEFKEKVQKVEDHTNNARLLACGWTGPWSVHCLQNKADWTLGANFVVSNTIADKNFETKRGKCQFKYSTEVFNLLNIHMTNLDLHQNSHQASSTKKTYSLL